MNDMLLRKMIELLVDQTPSIILAVNQEGRITEIFISKRTKKQRSRFLGKAFARLVTIMFPVAAKEILLCYRQVLDSHTPQMICRQENTSLHELSEYYCWNFMPCEDVTLVYIHNITESVLIENEFTTVTEQYQTVNQELYAAISDQDLYLMDLEQTKKKLKALYRITSIVQHTVDEEKVLKEILKSVAREFSLDNVSILLLDTEKRELTIRAHLGKFQSFCKYLRIPLEQGITGYAAKHRNIVYVKDVHIDPRYIRCGGDEVVSELALPLMVHGRVIGVFNIETEAERVFNDFDMEMFQSLANQIAITIAHASHVSSVEIEANTDGMTGLYNYRYFRRILEHELKRSKRYERSLSLLMMDIDSFKSYNDTHGHQQGDYLLRRLAEIIQQAVRDVDFVIRYGGEEFVVVLPETPLQDALVTAERIRQNIAEYPFEKRETQPNGIISVSIGVASFPRDADTDTELIQHADMALYDAKQSGKNCVKAYCSS